MTQILGRCNVSWAMVKLGAEHSEYDEALQDHALALDRALLAHILAPKDPLKELEMVHCYDRAHRLYNAVAKGPLPAD